MINKIKINNYKCFDEMEISFSDLTILSGANAVGKSSVIQSILLSDHCLHSEKDIVDIQSAFGRKIGNPSSLICFNSIKNNDGMDFSFQITNKKNEEITFKFLTDRSSYSNNLNFSVVNKKEIGEIFYLNAERIGPRLGYDSSIGDGIKHDGSNVPFLLAMADLESRKVHESLNFNKKSLNFSTLVSEWMSIILDDTLSVKASYNLTDDTTKIVYKNKFSNNEVIPSMTGFGISYIMPVVAAALWCSTIENAVLIIENPEAHMHPYSQSQMGKFLMLVSKSGVQVIIETHSEHILDGARYQAAAMGQSQSLCVNFFSSEKLIVDDGIPAKKILAEKITVDSEGNLSNWPVGFYDQKNSDLKDLFMLKRRQNK